MDFSKLPKIRDEDREAFVGYVYGVSGPGRYYFVKEVINVVLSGIVLIFTWKQRSIKELWVVVFIIFLEGGGTSRRITNL